MTRQIPWVRVAAEGVAIVLSILLAFGIQAWWDARGDDVAEVQYLNAVREEIDRNLSALDGNEGVAALVSDALRRAEHLLNDDLHRDSAATFVSSLLVGSIPGGPPRVSTAVFDDLTSSGRIVVIRDPEVRRAVLELYAQLDRNLQRWQRRTDAVGAQLYATVARHLPPGLVRRDTGSLLQNNLDSTAVSAAELAVLAEAIAVYPSFRAEMKAAFLQHEDERFYRRNHRRLLMDARGQLEDHLVE